jgi:transcription antitermination protein NusB
MALQILYQIDMAGQDPERALALFWENFERKPEAKDFVVDLVEGVWREREKIDKLIADSAEHWRLGRITRVDLNILRVATYELLCCPDTPTNVSINEAVEVARRYSTDDSPPFINGILDRIATVLGKKERNGGEI